MCIRDRPRAEAFRLLEALWDKEEEEGVDA